MHVRQLAWLHAAPRPKQPDRLWQPEPRIRRWRKDPDGPPLPPCPSELAVDRLFEAGPVETVAGAGRTALSWHEIDAWMERTRTQLRPYDAKLLRRLSKAYLAEYEDAQEEDCPPPWWPGDGADQQSRVEKALRRVFG